MMITRNQIIDNKMTRHRQLIFLYKCLNNKEKTKKKYLYIAYITLAFNVVRLYARKKYRTCSKYILQAQTALLWSDKSSMIRAGVLHEQQSVLLHS